MDDKEIKKLVGTEFTYVFEDGDTVQAYVKAYDPAIGLTCLSLETQTKAGWKPPEVDLEADGTFCVIGWSPKLGEVKLATITEGLQTGVYRGSDGVGSFSGCPF